MQKTLDSKTRKMKEFAGEINMYQAKVPIILNRLTNLNTTLNALRKKFRRSDVSTTNRKSGSR